MKKTQHAALAKVDIIWKMEIAFLALKNLAQIVLFAIVLVAIAAKEDMNIKAKTQQIQVLVLETIRRNLFVPTKTL